MLPRSLALLLLLCFAGPLLAQPKKEAEKEKEAKISLDEKWARSLGEEFTFDFYRATLVGREQQSFCCSPYSAMCAMAMLGHGTSGEGREEFAKLWPASSHPSANATREPWSSNRLAPLR